MGACVGGSCFPVTCTDGQMNNSETDVDCGGEQCPTCDEGKSCSEANDCTSGVCTSEQCQAAVCDDAVLNGNETDVDCGGADCPACDAGESCNQDSDCVSGSCDSQTGACATPAGSEWAMAFGDGNNDLPTGIAVDASGNIYLAGTFEGDVDFGGGTLNSAGLRDAFIASYDANGTHRWSKRYGSISRDEAQGVAVTAAGQVYITGFFEGDVDFGGGIRVNAGTTDIFLVAFDSDGSYRWDQTFGDSSQDDGTAIAVRNDGQVVIGGIYREDLNLGGAALPNATSTDMFFARYDSSGVHQASWAVGGGSEDRVYSLALDTANNVYITGHYRADVDMGGGLLGFSGDYDMFVASFDAAGAHRWSTGYGDTGRDIGQCIAVKNDGTIYVTGMMEGTVDFGGGDRTAASSRGIVIASYDNLGAHVFSNAYDSTSRDEGTGVAVGPGNSVLATGLFTFGLSLGGDTFPNTGTANAYYLRLDQSGAHQQSQAFGAMGNDYGWAVASTGGEHVVLAGTIQQTVDLGFGDLVSNGGDDIFLMRFVP